MRRWRHFVTPVCCVRCAVTVFSKRIKIHRVSRWFFSFGRLALILPGARIRRPGSHATFTCCPSTRPFRYLVLPRLPRSFFIFLSFLLFCFLFKNVSFLSSFLYPFFPPFSSFLYIKKGLCSLAKPFDCKSLNRD